MKTKDSKRNFWIASDICWLLILFTAFAAYVAWVHRPYVAANYNYTTLFWDSWLPLVWRNWALWHAYSVPGEFILWFGVGLLIRQLPVRIIGLVFSLYALGQGIGSLLGGYWTCWTVPQTILSTLLTVICIGVGILLGRLTGQCLLALWDCLKRKQ